MMDKQAASDKARQFFEDLWNKGDFWAMESSDYERGRFDALEAAIAARRYGRILEIGCGAGAFTQRLARHGDYVLGLDISPTAIERARQSLGGQSHVEFKAANVMEYDWRADAPWDLIILSETVYYLGWLYPFFDVGWMGSELFLMTRPGGHLLLANTEGGCDDALVLPWLIQSYHDLYRNIGFTLASEQFYRGIKDGAELAVRISLFCKPPC